jgi:signal transduction histidine kinase
LSRSVLRGDGAPARQRHGRGISADELAAIFEHFVQVDTGVTREHDGAGLGPAISREITRGMGGDVTVDSAEGCASTFTVVLSLVGAIGRGSR